MKSTLPKDPGPDRPWHLIDAAGKPLGRMAVQIANILRGKDLPTYSPQVDTGGFVVVVNAAKVKLTGRKDTQKEYKRYSGFPNGLKRIPAARMRERHPERMIEQAVRGMMPRNTLARLAVRRLKVYAGAEHPHAAQNPQAIAAK
jgi:large subunit ribosomal protein L13